MAHKFLITLTLFLLLFLGAGVFLWWNYFRPTPLEEFEFARLSPKSNFKVIQEGERKVVINEKDGLSFSVPGDWVLKEDGVKSFSDFIIYSPNAEIGERSFVLKRGCKISSGVLHIRTDAQTLEKYLIQRFNNFKIFQNNSYERITISNYEGIKHYGETPQYQMIIIGLHIPAGPKVFEIILDSAEVDKEICIDKLEEVFKTISIRPKLF